MGHKLITGPTVEPIDLATLKAWCRIDVTAEDTLLETLCIPAARTDCENAIGRVLLSQTWEVVLDGWPSQQSIKLPAAPAIAITSVKYIDTDGVEQTLSGSAYMLDKDSEPGWVLPAYGTTWPEAMDTANAVRVRYTAGYGTAATAVPHPLRVWVALRAAALWENRSALSDRPLNINPALSGLIDPYRIIEFV